MRQYIRNLDILRVIALLGVFLYHFIEIRVPSGYLGVCSFFVLAGFLSMYEIVDNDDKRTMIDSLNKIWYKIKKLLPMLAITIIIVSVIMITYYKDFLEAYINDAFGSLFFINNYTQLAKKESYFEAMYDLKPFTHMWALAIEMQFYIIFYILINTFYNKKNKKIFANIILFLIILSIITSFIILNRNGGDIAVTYYSLSSRIYSFLMGIYACIIYNNIKISKLMAKREIFGIIVLILIASIFFRYKNGVSVNTMLILYSILSAIACVSLCSINEISANIKIFNILSKRSYIIYLIHYPIIVFTNRMVSHVDINKYVFLLVAMILIIIISEIFYRINLSIAKLNSATSIVLCVLLVVSNIYLLNICKKMNIPNIPFEMEYTENLEASEGKEVIEIIEDKNIEDDIVEQEKEIKYGLDEYEVTMYLEDINDMNLRTNLNCVDRVNQYIGEPAYISKENYVMNYGRRVTIIGDSMVVCAKNAINNYFPNSRIEAFGNRQFEDAVSILVNLINEHDIGDVVIFALGTNAGNGINWDVLETLYSLLPGKNIVFCTVALPNVIIENNRNEDIQYFVNTHNNCYIADWCAASKGKPEIFQKDDIHPDGIGCYIYAQVLYKAMAEPYKEVSPGQFIQ